MSIFGLHHGGFQISNFVRFRTLTELFYNNKVDTPAKVATDTVSVVLEYNFGHNNFTLRYVTNQNLSGNVSYQINGSPFNIYAPPLDINCRYYSYKTGIIPNNPQPGPLMSPFGENLTSILITDKEFRSFCNNFFRAKGFELYLRTAEREFEIYHKAGEDTFVHSYNSISETLKRIVFFSACLETNKDAVLIFDEPEANTFPFYTKYLAERIALDDTNQYFFTTHNSYLLRSVVEKANKKDLNVLIADMENYETKIRTLTEDELGQILDIDIFLNLDLFINNENRP